MLTVEVEDADRRSTITITRHLRNPNLTQHHLHLRFTEANLRGRLWRVGKSSNTKP
ncbi:hypothetical protein Hanom_Chr08g00686101 [Helianthus anomalus]